MFKYLFKSKKEKYYILASIAIVMMLLASFLDIIKAFVFKTIIDFASGKANLNLHQLFILCLVFQFFIFIVHLTRGTSTFKLKNRIRISLREDILESICAMPLDNFNEKFGTSRTISIFNNDIEIIVNEYFTSIFNIVFMVSSIMFALIAIVQMNQIYLGLIIVVCSIIYLFMKYYKLRLSIRQKLALEKLNYLVYKVKNYAENKFLIKSNNISRQILKDFDETNKIHANTLYNFNFLSNMSRAVNETLSSGLLVSIYLISSYLVIKKELTIGEMVFVVQLATSVVTPILGLSNIINHINSTKGVRIELENLLKYSILENDNNILEINKITVNSLKYSFDSNNDKSTQNILNIRNYVFEKGKKYLIVGESGTGKSTFIKLLSKQLKDYEGEIIVNTTELNELSEETYFDKLKIVNQFPEFLNLSIEKNIVMNYKKDEARVKQVLSNVNMLDTVLRLENGLDTELNSDIIEISGGELQRLMIARSLYSQADFIIFDEPFSALDSKNKNQIEKIITSIEETAVIVISHHVDEESFKRYDEILDFNS